MLDISEREKVFIHRLNVNAGVSYLPFEISLPDLVKRIKAIIFSCKIVNDGALIGTISLQSNDSSDVFLCHDICNFTDLYKEESHLYPATPGSENDIAFRKSLRPQRILVEVDGTTRIIHGWYKPAINAAHLIRIYVEYEVQEERQ